MKYLSVVFFLELDVFYLSPNESFDVVVYIFPRNLPESSQPSCSHHCDLTKARTPSVGIAWGCLPLCHQVVNWRYFRFNLRSISMCDFLFKIQIFVLMSDRSELEGLSNNTACDVIGLVTYVGRIERVKSKSTKGTEISLSFLKLFLISNWP